MSYKLQDTTGRIIAECDDYHDVVSAAWDFVGEEGIVGHAGDLDNGGDRTLCWPDSNADIENDSGQLACAVIYRVM
jgi:hypothetical protein